MRVGKAKAVVVAPNIEPVEGEAGLSALLAGILSDARERGVPIVFALSRKRMGQVRIHLWLHLLVLGMVVVLNCADRGKAACPSPPRCPASAWAR